MAAVSRDHVQPEQAPVPGRQRTPRPPHANDRNQAVLVGVIHVPIHFPPIGRIQDGALDGVLEGADAVDRAQERHMNCGEALSLADPNHLPVSRRDIRMG